MPNHLYSSIPLLDRDTIGIAAKTRDEIIIRAAPAPMAMATPTPVAQGEQTMRLQVNVTWELVD